MDMKNKVDIDDFLILIFWVKTIYQIEGKKFEYDNLWDQAITYKYKNIPLDTNIHHIDKLMIDAFQIYNKIKTTTEKVVEILDVVKFPYIKKEDMLTQSKIYETIFEDLIENYKYEEIETRAIQKGFLSEKMKEYIAKEEYEKAANVRDIING